MEFFGPRPLPQLSIPALTVPNAPITQLLVNDKSVEEHVSGLFQQRVQHAVDQITHFAAPCLCHQQVVVTAPQDSAQTLPDRFQRRRMA